MNAFSELIKDLGKDAEQSLGKESAEEHREFHNTAMKMYKAEFNIMSLLNMMDFMSQDDRMVGMYSVTTSTFVTGMMAYRMLLEDVAPEMVEKVDAHLRKLVEEKANE
jgi:hypothetical protein